jgi:hypothetical protein
MAREGDDQVNGAVCPGITEVVEGARAHGIAAGLVAAARAAPRWPVAAAPLDPRLGQVFDTRDALGDVGDILTGPVMARSPDATGIKSSSYAHT